MPMSAGASAMLRPGRNIAQLTGLRGIAALGVVLHHAANQLGGDWYLRGQPMVDVFFVLSGFVMSYVYLAKGPVAWPAFARARFARIYPLHIATALAMALAGVLLARASHQPAPDWVNATQALREATLTMAMPVFGAEKLWNFPAWSISVEWWVYFTLFPLLAIHGKRLSTRQAALVWLASAVMLVIVLHLGLGKSTRGWPAFGRALVGFAGGWVACRFAIETNLRLRDRTVDLLCLAIVIGIYGTAPLIDDDAWYLILVYPLVVFGLATSRGHAVRLLSSRPVVWLGDISFSIYLVHSIVLNVLQAADGRILSLDTRLAWMVALTGATLVVAPVSYYLFEVPMRRLLTGKPAFSRSRPIIRTA